MDCSLFLDKNGKINYAECDRYQRAKGLLSKCKEFVVFYLHYIELVKCFDYMNSCNNGFLGCVSGDEDDAQLQLDANVIYAIEKLEKLKHKITSRIDRKITDRTDESIYFDWYKTYKFIYSKLKENELNEILEFIDYADIYLQGMLRGDDNCTEKVKDYLNTDWAKEFDNFLLLNKEVISLK